jgi:hypothetical protein
MNILKIIAICLAITTPAWSQDVSVLVPLLLPQATPSVHATPTPSPHSDSDIEKKLCGIIATEIYMQVEGSYWRDIIWVRGTFPDGQKLSHLACVWIPMKDGNVLMYDVKYGTFILPTKDAKRDTILDALRIVFPTLKFTGIIFLDEKS